MFCANESRVRCSFTADSSFVSYGIFLAEAAAFFAQSFKADASPKAPSPFSVLASAAIKGADQKIFRHHDSSLTAEDVILLFDLLAG
jgi:hypothetical protein